MGGIGILVALAAGVVSFASPCCLPMVPVYVSYLLGTTGEGAVPVDGTAPAAGGTATELATRRAARAVALRHALVFVAGFTTVFVALWASVGAIGYVLRDYVGALRVTGGIVLILFGLHTAGLVEISALYRQVQLPVRRLMGGTPAQIATDRPRYGRSLLLGVVFAAGWTPCVGPILGGIIGLASVSSSVAAGTVLLICYAIGLGIPFVLVALGVNEVSRRLRWLTRHHVGVGLVTGAALMITGFLMITNLFAKLSGALPAVGL
ncbi:MAG TPA: cytochrome c biogenesis protein CcdA [Kineosporiaceae bacterium]|nr:cytochrome c biogenesis protein CcdA [Kineosporiaceae bacterium]